ncbi:LuxR family transcriptional regulator, partial [Klebsiella pneumoniae]|nr:LuxR family transcriptional regulator [Klebsiella pneumoniae]HBY2115342.1 LuxR family transcriptional regulator [Klebsiella pneumoniae]
MLKGRFVATLMILVTQDYYLFQGVKNFF